MLREEISKKSTFCKSSLNTEERIFVALDVDSIEEVRALTKKLLGMNVNFKVGMRLFTKYGPSLVKELIDDGFKVFLDLKYHDIPNTVKTACQEAAELGVTMLTIHACGGKAMCKAAVDGAKEGALKSGKPVPTILAVTVLTSMDEASLKDVGVNKIVSEQVLSLAQMAVEQGVDGIVCSPQEVKLLKQKIGTNFVAVTPGIRLPENDLNDQKRVATPENAIADGSDYLVIGRPVYGDPNPKAVLEKIYKSIESVCLV